MKCQNCSKLIPINGFGGFEHYVSTKKSMDSNVKNGYFRVIEESQYERIYQCNECNTKWALAEPDFPVRGYMVEKC